MLGQDTIMCSTSLPSLSRQELNAQLLAALGACSNFHFFTLMSFSEVLLSQFFFQILIPCKLFANALKVKAAFLDYFSDILASQVQIALMALLAFKQVLFWYCIQVFQLFLEEELFFHKLFCQIIINYISLIHYLLCIFWQQNFIPT